MKTTIAKIQKSIAPELNRLNERIASTLKSTNPMMNRVVETYLSTKGKQIRPILVILSAKLFGEVDENVISAASAVELLHNASLIHDDVVDETKMRRGEKTVNGIWDNHIAVLVGDFFVSSALQQALATRDIRIVDSIAALGKLLSLGEIDQIYNARYHNLSEDAYFETIYRKTASLFVSCVEVGAYSVGADGEKVEKLREFGRLLGLCFQIRDDIFDYFNDDAAIGKPTGNDLREGKITLPLLYALTNPKNPSRNDMRALACREEELSANEIQILIEYAIANGGIEYAYNKMESLRNDAVKILESFPKSDTIKSLLEIFDFVIARNF